MTTEREDTKKTMNHQESVSEGTKTSDRRQRKKRFERFQTSWADLHDLDRDLRITGVTKKGSSWQYHVEVLDIRVRMNNAYQERRMSSLVTIEPEAEIVTPVAPPYPELPPMVRYSVMRRYNDFRQLYLYLCDVYSSEVLETLPKFPEGGFLTYLRGDDTKLLQHRKEQLQKFLRALDGHEQLKWCQALTHFLRPDIPELTTIGGAFHADVETNKENDEAHAIPNTGFARANRSGGYVSLSFLQSPEIRFNSRKPRGNGKQVDTRGDWKRRKIALANLYEQDSKRKVQKKLNMTEENDKTLVKNGSKDSSESANHDKTDDEDEEEEQPTSTQELLQRLTLDTAKS